jgi:DNA-binding transcriptional MerR regulator
MPADDGTLARRERERLFAIGELAAEMDLTPRTIRFYEDEGLLAPLRQGITRRYSYRDRARLRLICRGKRLGFSIAEIKEFLALYDGGNDFSAQSAYALDKVQARIRALEQQAIDVAQTLNELRGIEAEAARHLASRPAVTKDSA